MFWLPSGSQLTTSQKQEEEGAELRTLNPAPTHTHTHTLTGPLPPGERPGNRVEKGGGSSEDTPPYHCPIIGLGSLPVPSPSTLTTYDKVTG